MSETDILSIVNVIATKYGMAIEVDFDNYVINFTGSYDKKTGLACAKELTKIFG